MDPGHSFFECDLQLIMSLMGMFTPVPKSALCPKQMDTKDISSACIQNPVTLLSWAI